MKENKLTPEGMAAFKKWMGDDGIRYFRHLKGLKGTVVPVLKLNYKKKGIPAYPVHFGEGMQIRKTYSHNEGITFKN